MCGDLGSQREVLMKKYKEQHSKHHVWVCMLSRHGTTKSQCWTAFTCFAREAIGLVGQEVKASILPVVERMTSRAVPGKCYTESVT
jgi:hypothetical protein